MKYAKDTDRLSATIEALRDYKLRLEIEAVELVGLDSVLGRELAQERLEQAKTVEELFDYYTRL